MANSSFDYRGYTVVVGRVGNDGEWWGTAMLESDTMIDSVNRAASICTRRHRGAGAKAAASADVIARIDARIAESEVGR